MIKINESSKSLENIPIIDQLKYFQKTIIRKKGLRLTREGYLPSRIIKRIYRKKILVDYDIEIGITQLKKENDSESIAITRMFSELLGLIKKENNRIFITEQSEKYIENPELLKKLILEIGTNYNWAYFDRCLEKDIGKLGFQYSMYLLGKYGKEEKSDKFYAEKYFNKYPHLKSTNKECINMYSIRTFDRFLKYFGFVEIKEGIYGERYIKKTELFDRYIEISEDIPV